MNLAYIQFAPAFLDPDAAMARLSELLARAAGADLVVIPELANSGYDFGSIDEAHRYAEPIGDSRYLSFLREQCHTHGFEVCTGLNERDGQALYNSAVLLTADGIVGHYRKLHLFMNEKDFFTPGNLGLPVFDRPYGRVGMLICFDWIFPEAWRVLALRGADIICHPSNLVLPGKAQRAVPVHAMINRVFVVLANRCGTEGDLTFTGRSLIADPRGAVLTEAPPDTDHVGIAKIDVALARDKQATPRNHVFDDRRPADYGDLVQ